MKNPSDHNRLLDDLLGEDVRAESLIHTLVAARRERTMRPLRRRSASVAAVLLVAVAILLFPRGPQTTTPGVTQPVHSKSAIRLISEDELLAQFPGRAVGIVGPPERRQLVFLDRY
ncbi:MAG TPA: hypothetical protein VFD27_04505 [Chthoniobacteraceae bacterium]|nr:hypothetical protein [Chthoniobacteraceae bacterium]